MWRSSLQLGEQEIPTPSCSSSPSRLLRPAQTVHLNSTKAPYINIREFWTAIQEHALSLLDSGADPVNAMA
ncbi:hypothetical protein Taro_053745 [Colocasia esculenta]|uniref:Uncharacterized protein n=1 Tax=Colocasia esculenta TaxID=4460 RepID=A0A843XP48_COLES|nr:hypothetical protein [Colocasia esculenta]